MLQMPTTAAALAARVAVLESKLERQEELGMAAGDLSSMVGG